MSVSFVFTTESLVVSFPKTTPDGEIIFATETLLRDNPAYNDVVEAIKEKRYADIENLVNSTKKIHEFSDGNLKVIDGVIHIDGKAVPNALSDKIINFAEEGLPYETLLKFYENLNENPSHRSVQQTFAFLDANHYPLTPDGYFIAYKKVGSDFFDEYSHTFDNSPGKEVSMPRNEVDEDPDVTCSKGLHVASYSYAHEFSGNIMIEVKVNPRDVVAVPSDYNSAKMRVCKYLVLGIAEEEHRNEMMPYADKEQRDNWKNDRMNDWSNPDDNGYDDDDDDD